MSLQAADLDLSHTETIPSVDEMPFETLLRVLSIGVQHTEDVRLISVMRFAYSSKLAMEVNLMLGGF